MLRFYLMNPIRANWENGKGMLVPGMRLNECGQKTSAPAHQQVAVDKPLVFPQPGVHAGLLSPGMKNWLASSRNTASRRSSNRLIRPGRYSAGVDQNAPAVVLITNVLVPG